MAPATAARVQVIGMHYYSLAEKRRLEAYWRYLAEYALSSGRMC